MATKRKIRETVVVIAGSKPGTSLEDVRMESYVLALEPVPDEVLDRLATFFVRQAGDFMPSAGTIYQKALDLMDPEPSADEAWVAVSRHVKGLSGPPLTPRAARALAALGGKAALGEAGKDSMYRAMFVKAWESETRRDRERAALG